MKKFLIASILISFLVAPALSLAQTQSTANPNPIVSPPPENLCTAVKHDLSKYIENCNVNVDIQTKVDESARQLCCLLDLLMTIADYLFVILLLVAIVMIVWSGFEFVTAAGSTDKVNAARTKIVWALVGIAIALAAKGLVRLVAAILS